MSRKRQKTTRSLVSIIIPVYGRFDLLEKCLNSIPDIPDYHIVLVDDNSPEENKDEFYLSINREQHVTFIRNKENKGFAATCNIGADRSRSPLLFFLNTDVILHENAIDHLVREMDEPSTGICGMKLLFPEFPEGVPQEGRPPGKIQHN
ncbi:hypothetical protein AYK26_07680 [Euryarchaeota archaeon SM23-78]|nr:MAG: hypothetical protein AYK26_07680 [Euryarchaeota archaeon SM23-78]